MKKFIVVALVASVSMSALPAQDVQESLRQTADNVIKAFQKKDYKSIVSYFDDTMKKNLPENVLKTVWEQQITGSVGKFVKADTNVDVLSKGDASMLQIPCTFEKGKLNMQLMFNKRGQISGMFFKP